MSVGDESFLVLGWDVGGTMSGAVVGTAAGEILLDENWPSLVDRGPDAMLEDFLASARRMLASRPSVASVGVSIGGPMNARTGTILSPPHLPGWDRIPLRATLERELSLPVIVEHDAVACLLAEVLWGAAAGCSHAIYLTCGTGCGAGIIVDGRILRGPDGQSPEVGHVRLADDGPEVFGKAGCVESFCSGQGIALLAAEMFPERFSGPTDTESLAQLAADGNEQARGVLDEAARRTGQTCAILADIFSPQVITLGSLARYFGENWVRAIRREFKRQALPANSRHTRIVPAALGDRLQHLSAIAPCVYRRFSGE